MAERKTRFYEVKPKVGEQYDFKPEVSESLSQVPGTVTGFQQVSMRQPDGSWRTDYLVNLKYDPPAAFVPGDGKSADEEDQGKKTKQKQKVKPVKITHVDALLEDLRFSTRSK